MEIEGVDNVGIRPEDRGVEVGQPGGEMGKDEFLTLLVVQMQNQDPLSPVDNKEMIAQLAQFSSLEQMQNLNTQFTSFRSDTNLALSLMANGQNVAALLADGSVATGALGGFTWLDNELQVEIGGVLYPASAIVGLQQVAQETAAEEAAPEQEAAAAAVDLPEGMSEVPEGMSDEMLALLRQQR
jgi:flagellar basal-body rod modification protein FlgD